MERGSRTRLLTLSVLSCVLAHEAKCQLEPVRVADPKKETRKQALRLIRALELPAKRAEAAPKLLAMGRKALPGLELALRDPRPDVVARLVLVLRVMGEDARGAVPVLKKIAKDKDPKLAYAAQWALAPFEPRGITLFTESGGRSPMEIGPYQKGREQKITFTLPDAKNAFHAERLPNGRYLVSVLNRNVVQEMDRKGKVLWKTSAKSPTCATRLPSEHTLICALGDQKVIEVDPKGKIVWEYGCRNPYSAQRLANGNTLIAAYGQNEILEVSPKGKKVWSYTGLAGPLEAQRLANGNTLIAGHTGKAVHEVDAKGKAVLKIKLPNSAWSARRLHDGDTLVGGASFLIRFDKKGKERWRYKKAKTVTSVRYY